MKHLLARFLRTAAAVAALSLIAGQVIDVPESPYVPTLPEIVDAMLKLADVKSGDLVVDLGCGDGRIVIAAAHKFGARARGMELNPELAREARENARKAGVADRVQIIEGDLFEADVRDATVVALYLLPEVNLKLRPVLMRQLNRARELSRKLSAWAAGRRTSSRRSCAPASTCGG
jgi:SAM-dependent methyltransferase